MNWRAVDIGVGLGEIVFQSPLFGVLHLIDHGVDPPRVHAAEQQQCISILHEMGCFDILGRL